METAITQHRPAAIALADLSREFLAQHRGRTLETYRDGLRAFAEWQELDVADAVRLLFRDGAANANLLALKFRQALQDKGYSPATVNVRLYALRSLVNFAQMTGLVEWGIKVKGLKVVTGKDTTGPTIEEVRLILAEAKNRPAPAEAILLLIATMLLRRQEVAGLRFQDLDDNVSTIAVLGKGQVERGVLSINAPTKAALAEWLSSEKNQRPLARPSDSLFDLSAHQIWRLVRSVSKDAIGRPVWPHAFRHTGGTFFAELTGKTLDIKTVLRHADSKTAEIYVDRAEDAFGKFTQQLADAIGA